jgi:F-type H+-transporting ATPase subunit alpha
MMDSLENELRDWLAQAPKSLQRMERSAGIEHIGTVTRVGDAVASIGGLPQTRLGELLQFEDGTNGIALSVDQTTVDCVVLGAGEQIAAGMHVRGTGGVARVPVGEDLLGRVIDPLGRPLDGGAAPHAERLEPVERPAPGILDREMITEPLMTGITVVDAMIPLGRG